MTDYRVDIDDRAVRAALDRLIRSADDLTPAMRAISETLADSAERAFDEQRDPATGQAWAPLSPVTLGRRRGGGGRILQDTGRLAASITARHGRDYAEAGTNVIYGATQFFGARKGAFGRSGRGPIPWGDIPARPYLGVGDDERDEILDILRRHLLPGGTGG